MYYKSQYHILRNTNDQNCCKEKLKKKNLTSAICVKEVDKITLDPDGDIDICYQVFKEEVIPILYRLKKQR